jgi:hypothetical protein
MLAPISWRVRLDNVVAGYTYANTPQSPSSSDGSFCANE